MKYILKTGQIDAVIAPYKQRQLNQLLVLDN